MDNFGENTNRKFARQREMARRRAKRYRQRKKKRIRSENNSHSSSDSDSECSSSSSTSVTSTSSPMKLQLASVEAASILWDNGDRQHMLGEEPLEGSGHEDSRFLEGSAPFEHDKVNLEVDSSDTSSDWQQETLHEPGEQGEEEQEELEEQGEEQEEEREEQGEEQGSRLCGEESFVDSGFTELSPHNRRLQEKEELSKKLTSAKCRSLISDAGMEKIFRICIENIDTFKDLIDHGLVTKSFKNSLLPLALRQIPRIFCGILVEHNSPTGQTYEHKTNMDSVPQWYWNLDPGASTQLMRIEGYVHLADIKKHYASTHEKLGFSTESIKNDFKNCHLGADGVKECNKGKRTLVLVVLRIHRCVYPWIVLHPLIGIPVCKPTLHDKLR